MTVAQIHTPPSVTMIMRYEALARVFLLNRSLSRKAPSAKLLMTPRIAMTREPRALLPRGTVSERLRRREERGEVDQGEGRRTELAP